MENFNTLWTYIRQLQGSHFETVTHVPFTYEAAENYIITSNTKVPIYKSSFQKVWELHPQNVRDISRKVRGSSYIFAILTDRRIQELLSSEPADSGDPRQQNVPGKVLRSLPQKESMHRPAEQSLSGFRTKQKSPDSIITVLDHSFVFLQELIPETENGKVKEFYPQREYSKRNEKKLLKDGDGSFCRFTASAAKPEPGVYLWIVNNEIIYIGETVNLRQRFNNGYGRIDPINCYAGGQSTNCRMNKVVMKCYASGTPVKLYFCKTDRHKELELELLSKYCTRYNVKDNGGL